MVLSVGDKLPAVTLKEDEPGHDVKITEVFAGKRGVLFGVPGAYTPGCSKQHLPGFVQNAGKLKAAGAQVIVCISVNDPFVTGAWAQSAGAQGKVTVLADLHGEFARATGLTLPAKDMLGTDRIKRFSAVIEDNTVKALNIEPDGTGLTCSLAEPLLEQLKSA